MYLQCTRSVHHPSPPVSAVLHPCVQGSTPRWTQQDHPQSHLWHHHLAHLHKATETHRLHPQSFCLQTKELGHQLCVFLNKICSAYNTKALPNKEATKVQKGNSASQKKPSCGLNAKWFNMAPSVSTIQAFSVLAEKNVRWLSRWVGRHSDARWWWRG